MNGRLLSSIYLMIVSLLVAAGCGGGAGGGQAGDRGAERGETRTVEHAMGETEIRGTPERVVVLDTGELDSAMTLGVKPVGATETVVGSGYPSYLEGTDGIENVGTIEQPNLEAIAALDPDLILSSKVRHEAIYDELSRISPTVFTETTGAPWRENFELHAEALNRTREAERVVAGYEERVEELADRVGDPGEIEVSIVRFLPGSIRVYQKASFVGTLLEDVGFARPPAQDVDDLAIGVDANVSNAGGGVSREEVRTFDGDVLFYTAYGPEGETPLPEVVGGPLWKKLNVVRQGRAYEVSDDLWMLGIGYTAASGVLDDLNRYLVEEGRGS